MLLKIKNQKEIYFLQGLGQIFGLFLQGHLDPLSGSSKYSSPALSSFHHGLKCGHSRLKLLIY